MVHKFAADKKEWISGLLIFSVCVVLPIWAVVAGILEILRWVH